MWVGGVCGVRVGCGGVGGKCGDGRCGESMGGSTIGCSGGSEGGCNGGGRAQVTERCQLGLVRACSCAVGISHRGDGGERLAKSTRVKFGEDAAAERVVFGVVHGVEGGLSSCRLIDLLARSNLPVASLLRGVEGGQSSGRLIDTFEEVKVRM